MKHPASHWIAKRLARLPLLASRLTASVLPAEHFVSPSASLLPTLERRPQENVIATDDALNETLGTLRERSPLETLVLYITSDAGEGKTSLINQMAIEQARLYEMNKVDWLLVPIPLGGRHFLRFDDITIGALQNRYRFPYLYYSSFLALVKMGLIVPAFDGFEEMFVEGSSGEALSAMGILVGSLQSQGAIVVAARKAYFEFENLRTQERLFDTIRTFSVGFGKLELKRWTKSQFMRYCARRSIANAEEIYSRVSTRLGADHALLTRAVLVKRLLDVASKSPSLDALLEQIQKSGADFFAVFVRSLIEREATEKWIDRSGEKEVGTPLLRVREHCELLSQVALAMWEARVDYLKRDNLDFVAEYFIDGSGKNVFQAQQIRERIRGHAMLVSSPNAESAVEFDHDEFRLFFLGEGVARLLRQPSERLKAEVFGVFRRGILPEQAQQALVRAVQRDETLDKLQAVRAILEVASMDGQASYTQQNCSEVVIRLISGAPGNTLKINNLAFGTDSLRDKKLLGISFEACYFAPSSLELTEINHCSFSECHFTQLRFFDSTRVTDVAFTSCRVDGLALATKEQEIWNPIEIRRNLEKLGISYQGEAPPSTDAREAEADLALRDLQKIIRYFMRSTHISESVMLMKLGARGKVFIDNTLPRLIKHNVMQEIENRGGGVQRRFRLSVSLQEMNSAVENAGESLDKFLERFSESE